MLAEFCNILRYSGDSNFCMLFCDRDIQDLETKSKQISKIFLNNFLIPLDRGTGRFYNLRVATQ